VVILKTKLKVLCSVHLAPSSLENGGPEGSLTWVCLLLRWLYRAMTLNPCAVVSPEYAPAGWPTQMTRWYKIVSP